MFRRTKSESEAPSDLPLKEGGKGRPTPTRKEAEAAARARAKVPRTRKEIAAAQRGARTESSQQIRAGMKSGDERFLPARDKGPVRRFVRDYVDSRFSFIELLIPLLLVTLVLGWSGSQQLANLGQTVLFASVLLVVLSVVVMRFRLKREVHARFPDASTKGLTYYAVMRTLQMKFMRLPKAKVKIGEKLPEHYR